MKTLIERVIEQLQQENSIDKDEAHRMINSMCNSYFLTYMSNSLDEMFKEQWDQARNAIIASSR